MITKEALRVWSQRQLTDGAPYDSSGGFGTPVENQERFLQHLPVIPTHTIGLAVTPHRQEIIARVVAAGSNQFHGER